MIQFLSTPPAERVPAARFRVTAVVRNAGDRRADRSLTRLYMSSDRRRGGRDTRASAGLRIKQLSMRGRTSVAVVVRGDTRAGRYFVIACADVGRLVLEASERTTAGLRGAAFSCAAQTLALGSQRPVAITPAGDQLCVLTADGKVLFIRS